MKKRGQRLDSSLGRNLNLSAEEEKKKAKKDKEKSSVGPWVLGLLMFVVLGSSFLQIINNINHSPSMSEEH